MQRSDFCWVIAFRPFVLRATQMREPNRSPWVRTPDIVEGPVATTPVVSNGNGAFVAAGRLARHGRLTTLHLRSRPFTHLRLPPDPRSPSGPCHIGVGFPPSGPRDRISLHDGLTSSLSVHAKRNRTKLNRCRLPSPRS